MRSTNRVMENNWRQRLDSLAVITGSMGDRERNWNKLEQRLSAKRKRKAMQFFWIAAAALLILLPEPQLLQDAGPTMNSYQFSLAPLVVQQQSLGDKKINFAPVVQHAAGNRKKILKEVSVADKNTSVQQMAATVHDTVAARVNDIVQLSSTHESNLPVKRKLPVVHINEIAVSPVMAAPVASIEKKRTVKIRFFNAAAAADEYSSTPDHAGNGR